MRNSSKFRLLLFIIIILCIIRGCCLLYYFINSIIINTEITIGEIITTGFNIIISYLIFNLGKNFTQKHDINNKLKDHMLYKIDCIEKELENMTNLVEDCYISMKISLENFRVILQAKLISISEKVEYINKNIKNDELQKKWDNFRIETTDPIGNTDFSINSTYYNIFIKSSNVFLRSLSQQKDNIIKSNDG